MSKELYLQGIGSIFKRLLHLTRTKLPKVTWNKTRPHSAYKAGCYRGRASPHIQTACMLLQPLYGHHYKITYRL